MVISYDVNPCRCGGPSPAARKRLLLAEIVPDEPDEALVLLVDARRHPEIAVLPWIGLMLFRKICSISSPAARISAVVLPVIVASMSM